MSFSIDCSQVVCVCVCVLHVYAYMYVCMYLFIYLFVSHTVLPRTPESSQSLLQFLGTGIISDILPRSISFVRKHRYVT